MHTKCFFYIYIFNLEGLTVKSDLNWKLAYERMVGGVGEGVQPSR